MPFSLLELTETVLEFIEFRRHHVGLGVLARSPSDLNSGRSGGVSAGSTLVMALYRDWFDVLVPFDGSPIASAVILTGRSFPELTSRELILVTILPDDDACAAWEGKEEVGTMQSGGSHTTTRRGERSLQEADTIHQNAG